MFFRPERASVRSVALGRQARMPWRTCAAIGLSALSINVSVAQAQQAPLTLEDALARAEQTDPRLRAAAAGIDAAQGDLRQARARPNPELGIDVENFGGDDTLRGFDGSEATFTLSQQIERGGRRSARIAAATQVRTAAQAEALIVRLDVFEEVQRAYYDALAADALVGVASERLETAHALEQSVARRVAAARDPLMAGARAEAGVAEARIALDAAQREAVVARALLSSLIGGDSGFALAAESLGVASIGQHAHASDAANSPDLARAAAERERAHAEARLERARGYQDPTLSVGVRRFEESGETAFMAGVSMPFGVFDRNRGAIARAEAEERRAGYRLEAERLRLAREAGALLQRLEGAAFSVASTARDVIPQAERALSLARSGYNQGAFSYLDVLDAQRALSEARQRHIEALRTFHHTEAALDRLTARFADASAQEISQ